MIKIRLSESEKYKYAIDAIKKDLAYLPIELKKTWEWKYYLMNEKLISSAIFVNF